MADQTAESTSRGLLQGWIYRHDPPRVILSDQGPNVTRNWIEKRLRNLGLRNVAAHPEGDSQSEREFQASNRYCAVSWKIHRGFKKDEWPTILQEVSFHLNCLPSASMIYHISRYCMEWNLSYFLTFVTQLLEKIRLPLKSGWGRSPLQRM